MDLSHRCDRENGSTLALAPTASGRASERERTCVEPLSETRYRVEFTASAELREKLELCRDLMSHANPGRDLAAVVERAVDLLLDDLGKKRLGKAKRRRRKPTVASTWIGVATCASKSAVPCDRGQSRDRKCLKEAIRT
jgi:hypothetical protein